MRTPRPHALLLLPLLLALRANALEGTVLNPSGQPIPGCFLSLISDGPAEYAITDNKGRFHFPRTAEENDRLSVQPPTIPADGFNAFHYQPRDYVLRKAEDHLQLRLPEAVTILLEAYDADGRRMRWGDFDAARGKQSPFAYAVNDLDEAIPALTWWTFGPLAEKESGDRNEGLPLLVLAPTHANIHPKLLYWQTHGYGKLMLRADLPANASLADPGDTLRLHVNLALARAAVNDLLRRKSALQPYTGNKDPIETLQTEFATAEAATSPEAQARLADGILVKALRLRDELEIARALDTLAHSPPKRTLSFGVYEGAPCNLPVWKKAFDAGFDTATLLPAWGWGQQAQYDFKHLDQYFGIAALKQLGFTLKAHGVVWMQRPPILPPTAFAMPPDRLHEAAIAHQKKMLDAYGNTITIWETMNEPATTNAPRLSSAAILHLLDDAAQTLHNAGIHNTLINNPHELTYGMQYTAFRSDGTPVHPYPRTYTEFLRNAATTDAWDKIAAIGIQVYPGFHLNPDYDEVEGPCVPPAHLLDLLEPYRNFGKPIHITEFSLPSTCLPHWRAGYWRRPWDEQTQADYAEAAYLLWAAEPIVQFIGWWDISDTKPSVISGGLLRTDGSEKPLLARLKALMANHRATGRQTP
jgi:hypothetical protein